MTFGKVIVYGHEKEGQNEEEEGCPVRLRDELFEANIFERIQKDVTVKLIMIKL